METIVRLKRNNKVEIIARLCGHNFEIGQVVTINKIRPDDYEATDGKISWYVTDEEVKHIEKKKK